MVVPPLPPVLGEPPVLRDEIYTEAFPLTLVYAAYSLPFTVFFLTAFFRTLPTSVAEAAMVDGAYDLVNEKLRPGVRENDIVAMVNEFLYRHGSDDVEAVNAISGERCNPHPHNFTDRMIRPGDQAFFESVRRLVETGEPEVAAPLARSTSSSASRNQ